MDLGKVNSFGISINPLTMTEAVDVCLKISKQRNQECRYIVTPNVDHIVNLQNNSNLMEAYHSAALVLVDGKPVKAILHLLGKDIPEVVPGSDLVPALFNEISNRDETTVFLLGAANGVAERAKDHIESHWSGVKVVGTYSPPLGFEHDNDENDKIILMINERNPDILVIGLGSPKQEIWISNNKDKLHVGLALCVGATIDFIAGEVKRAPIWMRKYALEWLYRIYSDPRRLLRRYVYDALMLPKIVIKEIINK
jgi:N-acetylglucosaminyldiphosphoundecaprenol N-acetyl-beta-D-mannosaminyltransferase